jgi:hypothetical protein
MAFRYDEVVAEQRQRAHEYAANSVRDARYTNDDRARSQIFMEYLLDTYGPLIDRYPDWHPLKPRLNSGNYGGFDDHSVTFRDAILFAPYGDDKAHWEELSAYAKKYDLFAEKVEGELFHHPNCHLYLLIVPHSMMVEDEEENPYIHRTSAIEALLSNWKRVCGDGERPHSFQCWESWDTMRPYLIGSPCGKRSSLFVDEATGQAIKRLYAVIGQAFGLKEYGRV